MGRLRASVRYRSKPTAAAIEDKPVARLVSRRCGVAACGNAVERDDYRLCDEHYAALPANLHRTLVHSRHADAPTKAQAFIAALDYLEAEQSQLSTELLTTLTTLFAEGDAHA